MLQMDQVRRSSSCARVNLAGLSAGKVQPVSAFPQRDSQPGTQSLFRVERAFVSFIGVSSMRMPGVKIANSRPFCLRTAATSLPDAMTP